MTEEKKPEYKIGYIMPISDISDYKKGHWAEVKNILDDTVARFQEEHSDYNVTSFIVSESVEDNNIIQKNIVTNIYHSDLVICDVSSKNPNVMFELGMRLAFDKKIIVIKDEMTGYSFDTNVVNHTNYKKDLNYVDVRQFQEELYGLIESSFSSKSTKAGYLESFGDIKIQNLGSRNVDEEEVLFEILYKLDNVGNRLDKLDRKSTKTSSSNAKNTQNIYFKNDVHLSLETLDDMARDIFETKMLLEGESEKIDVNEIGDYLDELDPRFKIPQNIVMLEDMVNKRLKNMSNKNLF